MAVLNGDSQFAILNLLKGDSAFARYSAYADGTAFTETWSEGQNYLGIATGKSAPVDKSEYQWVKLNNVSGDYLTTEAGDKRYVQKTESKSPTWNATRDTSKLVYAIRLQGVTITYVPNPSMSTKNDYIDVTFFYPTEFVTGAPISPACIIFWMGEVPRWGFVREFSVSSPLSFEMDCVNDGVIYRMQATSISGWLQ